MTFSQFMLEVSPWGRLLLAIAIAVAISMLAVWFLHDRIEAFSGEPPKDENGVRGPGVYDLGGRVLALTGTAFVFLLAFTIGQFWGNGSDARTAAQDEAAQLGRMVSVAKGLPADKGRDQILQALDEYRASLIDSQWPLLARADAEGALDLQNAHVDKLAEATMDAIKKGAEKEPTWGVYTSAMTDLLSDGRDRLAQVPRPSAPGIIITILVLGVLNLALTAMLMPARRKPSLFLIGLMAMVTATLMFLVVEVANPYNGGGAVNPPKALSSSLLGP